MKAVQLKKHISGKYAVYTSENQKTATCRYYGDSESEANKVKREYVKKGYEERGKI